MSYNIIGDIAGNYKTLQALLAKMPAGTPVSVGDMVDRGPSSKEVLEFFKANGLAVLANHEHMMLNDYMQQDWYQEGIWLINGGYTTMLSFFPDLGLNADQLYQLGHQMNRFSGYYQRDRLAMPGLNEEEYPKEFAQYDALVATLPSDLMSWVSQLPMYLELDGPATTSDGQVFDKLFISHAPKRPDWSLELCMDRVGRKQNESLLWNRGSPRRWPCQTAHANSLDDGFSRLQVYGHNSYKEPLVHKDHDGIWGYCIDTSRGQKMTGLHWPSLELFEQEYID